MNPPKRSRKILYGMLAVLLVLGLLALVMQIINAANKEKNEQFSTATTNFFSVELPPHKLVSDEADSAVLSIEDEGHSGLSSMQVTRSKSSDPGRPTVIIGTLQSGLKDNGNTDVETIESTYGPTLRYSSEGGGLANEFRRHYIFVASGYIWSVDFTGSNHTETEDAELVILNSLKTTVGKQ